MHRVTRLELFLLLITSALVWSSHADETQLLTDVKEPKFGDRLRPRRREAISVASDSYTDDTAVAAVIEHLAVVSPNAATASPHRLEMSTEFFVIPPRSSSLGPLEPSVLVLAKKPNGVQNNKSLSGNTTIPLHGNGSTPIKRTRGALRPEPWAVPLLVTAALAMILMAAFEVFVLCKAWRTAPSRRHLFLGQMLLLGLFCCSGLGALLAAVPTPLTCAAVRFGAGVSCALVFAALLVKCVFLISLNAGVYLPAPYQGLLLMFAVLIQVAIGTQWLITTPPQVEVFPQLTPISQGRSKTTISSIDAVGVMSASAPYTLCRTPFSDLLASLVYVVFLIIFVSVLAVKSRGIRDNYREASYIGVAIGCVVPIWLSWSLGGAAVAGERHRDGCLGFGLVATAFSVFIVMYAPKGRQLAALGRDESGTMIDHGMQAYSTTSRTTASGYAPSFFHFKPLEYGPGMCAADAVVASKAQHHGLFMRPDDSNVYTSLEQTLSSNPNVYFQRGSTGLHPGMMY